MEEAGSRIASGSGFGAYYITCASDWLLFSQNESVYMYVYCDDGRIFAFKPERSFGVKAQYLLSGVFPWSSTS